MKIYSKKIPNTDISIFLRENSSDNDLYHVLIEDEEYGYFNFTYLPSIIIDAGANIGLSSIYFMLKYPSAKIFSIEPESDNFSLLVKNTEQYERIQPFHMALADCNGNGKIIDVGRGDLAYQVNMNEDAPAGTVLGEVECVTLQSFCDKNKIKNIDLLKLDIEGMEKKIFESDCSWLNNVNVLVIELHERICKGCNQTVFSVVKNYFDLEWIGGENYIFSKKGCAVPTISNNFKTNSPQKSPVEKVWELQESCAMNENNVYKLLDPIYHRIDNLEGLFGAVQELQGAFTSQRAEYIEHVTLLQHAVEEIQTDRKERRKQQQETFGQIQQAIDNIRAERDQHILSYDKSLCELQKEVKRLRLESESRISFLENIVLSLESEIQQYKNSIWYRIYKKTTKEK